MNKSIIAKLKKYVLYISTIFFVIIWTHLIYNYVYDGANSEAIEWGTVSEAIIWSFPNFNPLVPSNDHNAYINGLLYRSLLEYSTSSWNFESDIATCDSENLLYITCSIDSNALWSDGTNITWDDIKATLNIIKETKVNPIVASLLEGSTIEAWEDSISFTNSSKDINFLQVLLQPILPEKVVERLNSDNIDGKFSEINGVYSGRFTLASISQDETVGITKITLWKNENYFWNDMFIQFLILNLFRDESHFLKNKNSFNIFNDKDSIVAGTIPRLEDNKYTLSQFVWSFFNTQSLDTSMRTYISGVLERDEILSIIGEESVEKALNPFLSDIDIDVEATDFDLESYVWEKWYYSKRALLKNMIDLDNQENEQDENIVSNEAQIEETTIEVAKEQSSLEYIVSPTTQKYNFVSEDNILIQWRVNSGVDAVYINDYKLTWFESWDDVFYYRLLESFDSISQGENSYDIYFETSWEKELIEQFVYIYNTDTEKLDEIESSYFESETQFPKEEEIVQEEVQEDTQDISSQLSSEQIQQLSDTLYYNELWEAYSIKLIYTQADAAMEVAVQKMKTLLEENWILVNLEVLDLWDITVNLRSESLQYDIMVLWINLWYFESNIFPYFHSSQAENWYNFSNFKKLSVDILLEELKSNNLEEIKRNQLEEKMLEIIKDESIVKVFYTPKISLLADKNIKNYVFPSSLPDVKHRYYPLIESYLIEKRMINTSDKSVVWFFRYIISELFS